MALPTNPIITVEKQFAIPEVYICFQRITPAVYGVCDGDHMLGESAPEIVLDLQSRALSTKNAKYRSSTSVKLAHNPVCCE